MSLSVFTGPVQRWIQPLFSRSSDPASSSFFSYVLLPAGLPLPVSWICWDTGHSTIHVFYIYITFCASFQPFCEAVITKTTFHTTQWLSCKTEGYQTYCLVALLKFNDIVWGTTNDFTQLFECNHGDIFSLFQRIQSFIINTAL